MNGLHALSRGLGIWGTLSVFALMGTAFYFALRVFVPEELTDYRVARNVVGQMIGPLTLESAGFYEVYPEGGPSDFVAFLETEQGQRLWPMTTGEYHARSHANPGERGIKGRFLRPNDMAFVAYEPDREAGRQVVYIPDDGEMTIELRGYEDPLKKPVFIEVLPFPSEYHGIELR